MSPNKREREYARRRHEQWMERQRVARMKRRRARFAAIAAVGVLALTAGIVGIAQMKGSKDASPSPSPTSTVPSTAATPPATSLAEGRTWTADLTTSAGAIGLTLDGKAAPQAVASFVSLAKLGFFTNTKCHRLVTAGIFILQCGDPTGTGTGGPEYRFGPIENAPKDNVYPVGTVAMARVGDDAASQGSQFFFVFKESTIPADKAGGYTVLGKVTSGLDVINDVATAGVTGGGTDGAPSKPVLIQGVAVK